MTWEETCIVLEKYYEISPLDIPKMTLYQVAYHIEKVGWIEGERKSKAGSRTMSSAETIMGGTPGNVPSTADIRALARQINTNIVIPEN